MSVEIVLYMLNLIKFYLSTALFYKHDTLYNV